MSLRRIEITPVPRISTTSPLTDTSALPHSGSMAASSGRQHSNTPTSIQHEQQPQTAAQRRLIRIAQATAPSPAPASYERAHSYIPPPLPPGYKVSRVPCWNYFQRNSQNASFKNFPAYFSFPFARSKNFTLLVIWNLYWNSTKFYFFP